MYISTVVWLQNLNLGEGSRKQAKINESTFFSESPGLQIQCTARVSNEDVLRRIKENTRIPDNNTKEVIIHMIEYNQSSNLIVFICFSIPFLIQLTSFIIHLSNADMVMLL